MQKLNFFKLFTIFLFGFVIMSCPNIFNETINTPTDTEESDAEETNSEETDITESDKYFWGTWIRMDNGETYNITDSMVGTDPITEATTTTITYNGMTMTKKTDNVAQLGSSYLLFRKGGATRSFTAKISGFSDTLERGAGMGMQPIANRLGTRENEENDLDTETVTSDDNGILEFEDAVAGSDQIITVDGVDIIVNPQFDGEFVGSLPLVESGYSFKVTSSVTDKTEGYLYGQGFDTYEVNVSITNIGDADCEASVYTISSEDTSLIISGDTYGNFSSIEPGNSKDISISAQYNSMNTEWVDASIKIEITDSSLNPRTWEDYIVLRFYLRPVTLKINSLNLEALNSAALKGFLIHPDGNSQQFSVGSNSTESLTMPWRSEDYSLAFSGAGADTEMKYAFVVGEESLPDLAGTWSIDQINAYEPNDSELTATTISDCLSSTSAYLKKNDIDYYIIDISAVDSAYIPVLIHAYSDEDDGGNGDGIPNPNEDIRMDVRLKNCGTSNVLGLKAVLSTDDSFITITNNSFTYGDIPSDLYQSIRGKDNNITSTNYMTGNNYPSYSYYLDPATESAFSYSIDPSTPPDHLIPFTLTMTDSWGNVWTDTLNVTVVGKVVTIEENLPNEVSISFTGNEPFLLTGDTMEITADSECATDSFQWYLDGQPLSGETSSTLIFGSGIAQGNYTLGVRIQDGFNYYSESLSIQVYDILPQYPEISLFSDSVKLVGSITQTQSFQLTYDVPSGYKLKELKYNLFMYDYYYFDVDFNCNAGGSRNYAGDMDWTEIVIDLSDSSEKSLEISWVVDPDSYYSYISWAIIEDVRLILEKE